MEARIRVDGDADELRALHAWLRAEDGFRGRVRLAGGEPSPEEMGAVTDVLLVALGSGGAVAVLASSITVWLQQRRSDVTVEIENTEHGRSVKVSAQRVADAEKLIREVLDSQ